MRPIVGQISMFDMLDEYETPQISPEEQKAGTKGWFIERSGIFLKERGHDHDWRGVCTRPVILEKDTRKRDGKWWQQAHTTKGPFHGWMGNCELIFKTRPSWNDCLKFMAEVWQSGEPEEVGYYEIIGDWQGAKYEY